MPDFTYDRAFLVDVDGDPVVNGVGGQFLSVEGVAQQIYDLNGVPMAELTSSSIGVVSGFKADLAYGQVSFGSVALPVTSIERAGADVTGLAASAAAAAASAEASRLAAEAAEANTTAIPDAAADAAIDRAISDGTLASPPYALALTTGLPEALAAKVTGVGATVLQVITQSAYDALETKVATTVYIRVPG